MKQEILKYDSVEISFEKRPVVHDISFSLHEGEILALVGESGSGKSTLIRSALGLLNDNGKVTKGEITYKGTNLLSLEDKELRQIRGAEIGMIFQDAKGSLCPIRTIGDQIIESMSAHGKVNKAEAKAKSLELFEKLSFKVGEKIWNSYPFDLSGGQKRRVAIAGVLAMKPEVMILDEPTAGLDPKGREDILNLISDLHSKLGMTIILVSHSMEDVADYVDRIIVMNKGRVEFDGEPKEVFRHYKELEEIGLAAPQVTYCMQELRAEGFDVDTDVTTLQEAKQEILKALGRC